MRGQDAHYRLELDFLDAVNGAKRQSRCPTVRCSTSLFPPARATTRSCACAARAGAGLGGGPPGDALVEIAVRPHRIFTRKGDDIHVELPISLREAVLGGKINVPTPRAR